MIWSTSCDSVDDDRIPPAPVRIDFAGQGEFAGVVLVGDFVGDPQAYDLACPVEVKRDVRISIDPDQAVARCAVCGSTYDVFRQGAPLSGKAAEKGYAMRKYRVGIKTDGSRWIGN